MELAKNESYIVEENIHSNEKINKIAGTGTKPPHFSPTWNKKLKSPFERLKGKCYCCGSPRHRAHQCKFIGEICKKCNKQGHIASVCLGTKQTEIHCTETDNTIDYYKEEKQEVFKIHNQSAGNDKLMVEILIEGKPVRMELDTGAAISILPYSTFKSLNINKKIFHTNIELRTYSSEIIKPRGVVFVECTYNDQVFVGKLYIMNQNFDAIFGREWIREVKLDWAEIKTVSNNTTSTALEDLLDEFKELFEPGVGLIPHKKAHLQLVEGARPIFVKARPVPYALTEKVELELNRLEEAGIISKTDKSDWGTPIVPVVKPNGNIRICADYKVTVNKQIKEEHHPIPRIEDIFAQMNGGQLFCTLDLSNAYLHLEMDAESAEIQTLSTHKGQYIVNRLMFGVKVAPGVWQKVMDGILQDLQGVQCFFDDIIIQGTSSKELLERLKQVFERLRSQNLKLNRDKCKFFQKKIEYLGHVIDATGIHKSKDKITAITNARRPQNIQELRSFLGLVNYYNRFVKNLSTVLNPLHGLLKKGQSFIWDSKCEESFQNIKKRITSDTVLCHLNPDLPLILATDASPVGLGAVISHRFPDGSEKPIAFASRSLTNAEKHYSQIDKEATGIYWGLKKFFSYCYGRHFTLITDHKPLVSIFNPNKSLPSMSATRLFNYSHFLSGFNYTIEFKRTGDHGNADFLSRFPVEDSKFTSIDQFGHFQTNQLNTITINPKELAEETKKDAYLKQILEALEEGQSLEPLGFHDNEVTLHEGCLFKGWKVIIPNSLKKRILNELHYGHIGKVKTKALARSYCFWRGMDKDIENMIAVCKPCREKQNSPTKEINHPWEPATQPWERIHIDFMGPTNGQQFFIVVDAFSKWVEVIPTKTATTDWTIKELKKLFSTFGLPSLLISDNGRSFTSLTFQEFLKSCGTQHKKTAPFHPSSNGQAERFVQTVKKMLKLILDEPGTLDSKIHKALIQLRQVPNSTGNSAYYLMFNTQVRTYLSVMIPSRIEDSKDKPKGITRIFKVGDRVQVINYYKGQTKWSFGKVTSRDGNLHYNVELENGVTCRRHVDQMLRSRL
ncbi:uncharacterized protein K02A2.6-like [Macrosteles quadrilineatus]|uniref:uncharacterized protein K02A2.6-like n=1 Tax=Macrosteles quadrilineatus TaxID=74068 RepID=UPI0023E1C8F4|nr:uncharacterized protein K02A2.6-like [Macrosteles quadrilineatus]